MGNVTIHISITVYLLQVLLFVKNNTYYSAGFTGGFFFGIASS